MKCKVLKVACKKQPVDTGKTTIGRLDDLVPPHAPRLGQLVRVPQHLPPRPAPLDAAAAAAAAAAARPVGPAQPAARLPGHMAEDAVAIAVAAVLHALASLAVDPMLFPLLTESGALGTFRFFNTFFFFYLHDEKCHFRHFN